jgi:ABC-type nitrate/sulfonate/bicarbonate transport system substrate-binding protein
MRHQQVPAQAALARSMRTKARHSVAVLGALMLAVALVLTACSGGGEETSASKKAGLQFVFIKNVQFAGSYFADQNGYWKDAGLNVELMAGGPNLTVEPVVTSGKALIGITHTAQAVAAINNGADLQIIGAGFQRNPFVLISQAANPIKTPQELPGKKIGVQALDLPVFEAFLTANNVDKSTFEIVPLQADPTPLVNGELDGIMGFYSNEPNFLRVKGVEPYNLRLDDFNYPLLEELYIVQKSSLEDPATRARVVALMSGEARGWADALGDIDESANLAVNVYGKDLDLDMDQQVMAMTSQVDLVQTPETEENGLLWMSDESIAGTINSLKLGGVEASPEMFNREILEEIKAGEAAK